MVAYLQSHQARGSVWQGVLRLCVEHELPIVFVVLPADAADANNVSAASLKLGIPAIAVDGSDAPALYRVAQESIGRARMGGGAALIECVAFRPNAPVGRKPASGLVDPLPPMAQYMLHRKVCTQAWIDRLRS